MKIIITTSNDLNSSLPEKRQDLSFLDWQVDALKKLKYKTVIVVDKNTGENILSTCKLIEACDLAFDSSEEPTLVTHIRAGLTLVQNEAVVLPLHVPCPDFDVWQRLFKSFYRYATNSHIHYIRPYCPINGSMTPGFPLIITQSGRLWITNSKHISELNTPQLNEQRVPVLDPEITGLVGPGRQSLPNPPEYL